MGSILSMPKDLEKQPTLQPQSEISPSPETIHGWEKEWLGASTVGLIESFKGDGTYREEQKKSFLQGETRNPHLDLPNLNTSDLLEQNDRLSRTMEEIETRTTPGSVLYDAYTDFITRKQAETMFLMTADKLKSEPDNTSLGQEFGEQSAAIYGVPDRSIFTTLTNRLRMKAEQVEDIDEHSGEITRELLQMLPETEESQTEVLTPPQSLIDHYQERVHEKFAPLLAVVPEDQEEFNPDQMAGVFEDVLDVLRSQEYDPDHEWQVEVQDTTGGISVRAEEKKIIIPGKRSNMSHREMREKVVHEGGVHLLRSLNGEQSGLLVLSQGLADYYDAEEGMGVVMEQLLNGQPKERGVQHYLNTGLALGLDGTPRDFRDTFEIAWRREAVNRLSDQENQQSTDDIIKKSKQQAYRQCERIFRGTPAEMPGVVFTKDLAYFNGNYQMWQYLEQNRGNEEAFDELFAGKFDPANETHVRIIESLKVTEYS